MEIDALTGNCYVDQHPIPPLAISVEWREWLREDLKEHQIPMEAISRAKLKANLSFSEIPWKEKSKPEIFFANDVAVRTASLYRCAIECESEVATDEAVYRSKQEDVEEWPPGWPAT